MIDETTIKKSLVILRLKSEYVFNTELIEKYIDRNKMILADIDYIERSKDNN